MDFTKKNTLAMKGIAILMMLFHHLFLPGRYEVFNISFAPFSEELTIKVAFFFKICVAIFAFLTGYGLMIKHLNSKENEIKMIAKRYISLISGFIVIFALSQTFYMCVDRRPLTTYASSSIFNSFVYFLIDGLGLASLFGTPSLNGTWWYMSLALVLIAIIPLMIRLYKKFGFVATSIIIIGITHVLNVADQNFVRFLYATFLGIVCADKNILVRLKSFKLIKQSDIANKVVKFLISTSILVFTMFLRQGLEEKFYEINDAIIPLFAIYYCFEFIMPIKYLNNMLMFLGKHSTNIFLLHTFIRLTKFTYSFKYHILIFIVLLVTSLIASIIIEFGKKYSGYNKFVEKIKAKI